MLRTLQCKNYKAFDAEVTFPLAPLTVLVGPNNGGKSTVLDLARLTKKGRSLELSPENDRLCDFESLLGNEDESLLVGRRVSTDITIQVGSEAQTCRLADDIYVQAEFSALGEGSVLTRRDLYLCPRGTPVSKTPASKKRRVVSEIYEIGPPKEREASLKARSSETGERRTLQTGGDLWFGVPWEDGEDTVRSKPHRGGDFLDREEARLRDPYQRWVSRTLVLEKSYVQLGTQLLNDIRRGSGNTPIDFSEDAVEFRVEQKEPVPTKDRPPEMQFLRPDVVVREHLRTPDWVAPSQEAAWETVRRNVLAPLLKKMNRGLVVGAARVPSFRARPEQHYGPEAPMTPLLRDYREAHPAVRTEVRKWMEDFQIGSDLRVETVAEGLYAPFLKQDGQWRSLSKMGSGTAQLVPLILRLTAKQVSSPLLVEEPEAHLHPELQARLAGLLADVMMRGHQVLVETHSEHLVRRLQYLIAEGELESDHASVLYVDAAGDAWKEKSPARLISIDDKGQLSAPLGDKFFDESSRLSHLFQYGTEN